MGDKKIPQRMCVVCRKMFDKGDLVRLVLSDGKVSLDTLGKKSGRGAYICKNGCIYNAAKTHCVEKNFKIIVESGFYDELIKEFERIER
jgi:hypothetical protein